MFGSLGDVINSTAAAWRGFLGGLRWLGGGGGGVHGGSPQGIAVQFCNGKIYAGRQGRYSRCGIHVRFWCIAYCHYRINHAPASLPRPSPPQGRLSCREGVSCVCLAAFQGGLIQQKTFCITSFNSKIYAGRQVRYIISIHFPTRGVRFA